MCGQLVLWDFLDDDNEANPMLWKALLVRHSASVSALLACQYEGSEVFVSGCEGGNLALWDAYDGRCLHSRKAPVVPAISDIVLLPDNLRVACFGGDSTVHIVKLQQLETVEVINCHADWVAGSCIIPGSGLGFLVSVGLDERIAFFSLDAQAYKKSLSVPAPKADIHGLHAFADGRHMLLVSGKALELLSVDDGAAAWHMPAPPHSQWAGASALEGDRILAWHGCEVVCFALDTGPGDAISSHVLFRFKVGTEVCAAECLGACAIGGRLVTAGRNDLAMWRIRERGAAEAGESGLWSVERSGEECVAQLAVPPKASRLGGETFPKVTASAVVEQNGFPVSFARGHGNGAISVTALEGGAGSWFCPCQKLAVSDGQGEVAVQSCDGHGFAVTTLLVPDVSRVSSPMEPLLVSGGSDHVVRLWNLRTGECLHSMHGHAGAVTALLQPPARVAGAIRGTVASVGRDRSVIFTSLETFDVMFILGGHPFPVSSLGWLGDSYHVVVFCSNSSAHVWSLDSGMLDRSERGARAVELKRACDSAGKGDPSVKKHKHEHLVECKTISQGPGGCPVQLLDIQLRKCLVAVREGGQSQVLEDANADQGVAAGTRLQRANSGDSLSQGRRDRFGDLLGQTCLLSRRLLRLALSLLAPWGISSSPVAPQLDELQSRLHMSPAEGLALAMRGHGGALTFYAPNFQAGKARWQCSSYLSALHTLCGVSICLALLSDESAPPEEKELYSKLIVVFCSILPKVIPRFCRPSFAFLAHHYQDTQDDLRNAARSIFGAVTSGMSTDERLAMVEEWRCQLPQENEDISGRGATAVLILGALGSHNAATLDGSVCKEIVGPLWDLVVKGGGTYQAVATQLVGDGFPVWLPHLDETKVVWTLFELTLATGNALLASTAKNALIMAAVHVPGTVVQVLGTVVVSKKRQNQSHVMRKQAALKALSNLVSKHPAAMMAELSRLVEVIVRALDPNVAHRQRDRLLPTVTSALHELVNRYPMVAFHQESQRLAAGVPDKSLILLFDLKTATKLMALEGHAGGISAVAFRGDGKALASYSREDETVRVWALTSGFLGVFGAGGKLTTTVSVKSDGNSSAFALDRVSLSFESDKIVSLTRGSVTKRVTV